ncbi:acyl-CoA thioesterase [Roseomonas sp. NAR14]|uniref:Acyl-CoA thioesterase n=1 Tax=Roseomonas acroporae TaxID=2937791 RepID=A0A9X2BXG4_9PROT|nr:thioesterase family protein [Roseomonas acroporae]MCK8787211.1 acyl-CoA thioesterase [Roseomonas acroporae]
MSDGRAPLPTPERYPFWTEEKLRFGDTDLLGHINNSAYSVFCESGRVEMLRQVRGGVVMGDSFIVIVRLAIDFRQELHYPGTVRVGSAVTRIGNTSFTVEQGLFGAPGCVATSEAVCVLLGTDTRRPVPIPEAERAQLLALAPLAG